MTSVSNRPQSLVHAATLAELQEKGQLLVRLNQQPVALFYSNDRVYAIDNRCPHMGFPLHGSVCKDGIVTCPWHYARFDLASGGTFDSWADDVRSFPVQIHDGEIWVDVAPNAIAGANLPDGISAASGRSLV